MKKHIWNKKMLFLGGVFVLSSLSTQVLGRKYTYDKNTTLSTGCVLVETWVYEDFNDNDPTNDVLLAYHRQVFGENCTVVPNEDYTVLEATPNPAEKSIMIDFGKDNYSQAEFISLNSNSPSLPIPGTSFTGKQEIDISMLKKGTYILKAQTNTGKVGFVRIIKK